MSVTTAAEPSARNGPSWGAVLGGAAIIISLIAIGLVLMRWDGGLFRKPPAPQPPPGEKLIQAPGPDNQLKVLPSQSDAPGPDNTIKSRPAVEPAVPPSTDPPKQPEQPDRGGA